MWLPIVQESNGELGMLVRSLEEHTPGSGYRHLDECLKASSPLTSMAHARAYLRFKAWANANPPKGDQESDRLAVLVTHIYHLTTTLKKKRTVPRALLEHIGWVDTFLGERQPWPVKSEQVIR